MSIWFCILLIIIGLATHVTILTTIGVVMLVLGVVFYLVAMGLIYFSYRR